MSVARCWVVLPAAGIGRRMGADCPKQYLSLQGQTVIEHSLGRLLAHPAISGAVVAVAEHDSRWPGLPLAADPRVRRAPGGAERADSVLNALLRLAAEAAVDDWVLVHDAARPCLRAEDIDALISAAQAHPVGALLALPVRDTMKRADAGGAVAATVERERLWHALTPQMFRLGALRDALQSALAAGHPVTDEASALQHAGLAPLLVEGHEDNIKITRPRDLALAALYLRAQADEAQAATREKK